MTECLWPDGRVFGPLQVVITEHCGGVQGGFDIAGFQPVQAPLRMMCPDTRQAIGL
ncbi:hypothetical protein D3C81_1863270 [compost metagenome]